MNIFIEATSSGAVTGFGSSATATQFLKSILGAIMYMSIPVIGLVLVYAGFMFITARGNTAKISTAIHNFTYIVAGIALVLGSYMIAMMVYNTIIKGILGWA